MCAYPQKILCVTRQNREGVEGGKRRGKAKSWPVSFCLSGPTNTRMWVVLTFPESESLRMVPENLKL